MEDIKEVSIDGEKLYLKKSSIFGWNVVEPIRIDGKINWKNVFGFSRRGLISLGFVLVLCVALYIGVNELIGAYKTVAENPCLFCKDCFLR